jgi:hypothetical protein
LNAARRASLPLQIPTGIYFDEPGFIIRIILVIDFIRIGFVGSRSFG